MIKVECSAGKIARTASGEDGRSYLALVGAVGGETEGEWTLRGSGVECCKLRQRVLSCMKCDAAACLDCKDLAIRASGD